MSGNCRKGENEHLTPRAPTDSPVTQTLSVKAGCGCRRTLSSGDKATPTSHFAPAGRPNALSDHGENISLLPSESQRRAQLTSFVCLTPRCMDS